MLPLSSWAIAFLFGLVHGFGFANVLLDLGLTHVTLAVSLLGFNVGVELGQLAIVMVLSADRLPASRHEVLPTAGFPNRIRRRSRDRRTMDDRTGIQHRDPRILIELGRSTRLAIESSWAVPGSVAF